MEENKKDYVITIEGRNKKREIRLSAFMFNFGILVFMTSAFIFIGTCSYSVYSALHYRQNVEAVNEFKRAATIQQEQLLVVSKKAVNLSETIQNLAQQEEELRIQAGLNKPAKEDKISEENLEENLELEEIPTLENIPATVETSAPVENPVQENQSAWTPPAPVENVPATVETPAPVENPVQEIKSAWTPPAPVENVPATVENPAPIENPVQEIKSEWLPPTVEGAYTGQGGPLKDLEIDDVSEALRMIEQRLAIRLESLDEFQNELKVRREQMAVVAVVPSTSVNPIVIDGGFVNSPSFLDLGQFGGSPAANPTVPSIWPTTGVVTSPYGLRWGGTDFHPGIDIANDLGTPIVATADGVVEYAGWNAGGYGNMVDINHGNGLMTRYGHASQVVVTAGQYVKRGQLIAYMGSTGFSTGPHVHYEVHVNGQRVNPISYL